MARGQGELPPPQGGGQALSAARRIVVYSTPLCPPCEALKRFLAKRGVPFVAKDLMMDADAAELVEGQGIRISPVLGIDGRLYAGPELAPDNLEKLLGL